MQKTIDMSYDHADFSLALARLRAASYSADQALHAAGVTAEDTFEAVCEKLATNIDPESRDQPFMSTDPNWLAYATTSRKNHFGFSLEQRESDGHMAWLTWIEVPLDRTSTLVASCYEEGFRFDEKHEVFDGYDWREAHKRLAADKAAKAFGLDRGQVYDLLMEQVEAKRAARYATLDENGEPIASPFESCDWDEEDDDESYLGSSTLAKLRDSKLFDEDDEE